MRSPTSTPRTSAPRWLTPFALTLVFLLHGWLAVSATRLESNTVDEKAHLTAGHAILAVGDFRLQPENGVLPQVWEALPAWWQHRTLPPPSHPGWAKPNVWALGEAYFFELGNDLPHLLLAGRAMNVFWSLATGALVFAWTRRLFGSTGAWVALLFWAFCPTFLAHGALATSDLCMTFLMLASVTAYWRHLDDLRWTTLGASAAMLSLAFVAKFSAVLIPPMLVILATLKWIGASELWWQGRTLSTLGQRFAVLIVSGAVHLIAVWVTIWAFHEFRFLPSPNPTLVNDYTKPWAEVLLNVGPAMAHLLSFARGWHLLPDAYLYGFGFVVDMSQFRGAFLNGETSFTGWAQFFPYAFLVKTPIALLLTLPAAGSLVLWRGRSAGGAAMRRHVIEVAPLVVLFLVYWGFSLTSSLNIGQRHLLPTYPVIFIAAGALGWAAQRVHRAWSVAAVLLVASQVVASTSVRPHYLAYFNAFAGGPAHGYRHLVDSSLDWGQDLPGLASWLRQRGMPSADAPVYLAYFGNADPEYYGIRATLMIPLLRRPSDPDWYELKPGIYAVSATMLSQAYSDIRGPWTAEYERQYQDLRRLLPAFLDYHRNPEHRPNWEKELPAAKWRSLWSRYEQLQFARLCYLLRARNPDDQIGYSINLYRLSAADVAAVTSDLKTWVGAVERAEKARASR